MSNPMNGFGNDFGSGNNGVLGGNGFGGNGYGSNPSMGQTWGQLNTQFNTDVINDNNQQAYLGDGAVRLGNGAVIHPSVEQTPTLVTKEIMQTGNPSLDALEAVDAIVHMSGSEDINRASMARTKTGMTNVERMHSQASAIMNNDTYTSTDARVNAFLGSLTNDELGISKYGTKDPRKADKHYAVDENDPHRARTEAINELMRGRMNGSRSSSAADDYREHAGKHSGWNSSSSYGAVWIITMIIGFLIAVLNIFNETLPIPAAGRFNMLIGFAIMFFGWGFLRAWDMNPTIPSTPTSNTDTDTGHQNQ